MSVEQAAHAPVPSDTPASTATLPRSPQFPSRDSLQPCAATAAYFLFAQGSAILSLHHDTLALDRRFEGHESDVAIIAVDNVSEKGAGRLVVSYDTAQTGIVWDLFTGNEISRFASFELIRVAAWMRNGNVAFGNARGEVVLFEPSTSEHISSRTIFDPITALAPAPDCQTHAIGYLNGSILIAKLQPSFTILHTLSTSRGPSPIVSLAWHASSTKQKSDMLATQSVDGDLFLWSVSKKVGDAPRVIRSLKRSETRSAESRWLGWSKNGRILQHCDGETWSWDVRTKHVTHEPIPTVQGVIGIASYGPTATLFTLGPNHTVQQYDVGSAIMTANVQHLPSNSAPTNPTTSIAGPAPDNNSQDKSHKPDLTLQNLSSHLRGEGRTKSSHSSAQSTPIERTNRDLPEQLVSPPFGLSRTDSASSDASSHRQQYHYKNWAARSIHSGTGTSFSTGSPVTSVADSLYSGSSLRFGTSASAAAAARARQGSKLRNERLKGSEDDGFVVDLFPYARGRLSEIPYSTPRQLDEANSTPDQLRKHMLNVVFGWNGKDIEELIRDEIGHHPAGSPRAIMLSRWLGHLDADLMMSMAGSVSSSYMDWMLLALSQLDKQPGSNKIGRQFVQRLLSSGDIHASVAILLGMGDGNDAVEVYESRNMYMEAILLSCLLMPSDWPRLSYLVRKWGEHVVQNSQQHLAIRCFTCTAGDSSDQWSSPSAQMTSILSDQLTSQSSAQPVVAPTLSPAAQDTTITHPGTSASAPPPTEKNPSLKLITSFGSKSRFKFPGLNSADGTPTNAPGVTPIDSAHPDSALSPGGNFNKSNSHRGISQTPPPKSLTPSSFAKHRLPSIGETPTDVTSPTFAAPRRLPTPGDSGSEKEKRAASRPSAEDAPPLPPPPRVNTDSVEYLSPVRYDPEDDTPRETPQTAFAQDSSSKAGPDDSTILKPTSYSQGQKEVQDVGTQQSPPHDQIRLDATVFTDPFASSRAHQASPRAKEEDSSSARYADNASVKSATDTGRSIDEHISSSLDEGSHYHSRKHRWHRRHDGDYSATTRSSSKGMSRGRSKERYIEPAKRSPSSPVPMSPEDLAKHSSGTGDNAPSHSKSRSRSKPRSAAGRKSPNARADRGRKKSASRTNSPDHGMERIQTSTRSRSRLNSEQHAGLQSPPSPVPMSLSVDAPYDQQTDDRDDKLRLVNEERRHRLRSADRSSARRKARSSSGRRDASPAGKGDRDSSRGLHHQDAQADTSAEDPETQQSPMRNSGHRFSRSMDGNALGPETPNGYPFANIAFSQSSCSVNRKEQAAAELEARRRSLARRPSAPAIPLPSNAPPLPSLPRNNSEGASPQSNGSFSQRVSEKKPSPTYSASSDPSTSSRLPCNVPVGLPSTPRAMRHPKYSIGYADQQDIPPVPSLPDGAMEGTEPMAAGVQRTKSAPDPEGDDDASNVEGLPAHPQFNRQLPSSKVHNVAIPQRRQNSFSHQPLTHGNADSRSGETAPLRLPELQHLHPPPPPPPLPAASNAETNNSPAGDERYSITSGSGVGTINIAIDNGAAVGDSGEGNGNGNSNRNSNNQPQVLGSTDSEYHPSTSGPAGSNGNGNGNGNTTSRRVSISPDQQQQQSHHRRGRSINENLSHRLRSFTDRMRSTSRNRYQNKSPPMDGQEEMPYESVKMGK